MTRMWRAVILALVWSMATASPGGAQDKDDKAPKDATRPEISLKVSPLISFSPARKT